MKSAKPILHVGILQSRYQCICDVNILRIVLLSALYLRWLRNIKDTSYEQIKGTKYIRIFNSS